ncbi:MAG: metal-dependent phosphohydrolase [Nitrosomonadales bacterium]|nr:metal-dependent phosphohydrolase [Nitrosomonadales bacterium]
MNKLYEFSQQVIHPVDDQDTPTNLAMMPKLFRLTENEPMDDRRTQCTATLFHDSASLRVHWIASTPDMRLKSGDMVSPRWFGRATCKGGAIKISRLVLMERPEPWQNLFNTIPHDWVNDRALVRQAARLMEGLPRSYRYLFNAIFWDGQRFKRFCTVPSSVNGHHAADNGNLQHAVEVAQSIQQECQSREMSNVGLGILAGFLHDAGKADEYKLAPGGKWQMTDRGKLLGHKITVIEWIAQAKAKWNLLMPENHYMALLHCLTSSPSAPEWLGIRKPAMIEALLLSCMDRLSGTEDLMRRCTTDQNGWGAYHAHLSGKPYRIDGHLKVSGEVDDHD